jgi:hypothetical protein
MSSTPTDLDDLRHTSESEAGSRGKNSDDENVGKKTGQWLLYTD